MKILKSLVIKIFYLKKKFFLIIKNSFKIDRKAKIKKLEFESNSLTEENLDCTSTV